MIDRNHLSILREIDRQGSLTAAARTLCLTQPALSHTIRKLEQQIGTAIWARSGRHLRLTQAGQHLLGLAERLLPQFEHADEVLRQIAQGQRGELRIGMECHPCYQWLLKVMAPYLQQWPGVDVDVKQRFQFGGIGALFSYDIDVLVTPDPLFKPGLEFQPVFDYEQVLVLASHHPLAGLSHVEPDQLREETLITYPVEIDRLDIFREFFLPAQLSPKRHKRIETTDMMLQMVAAGRGVTALPRWLVEEYAAKLPIRMVRLGASGIAKKIFLGTREADLTTDYLSAFLEMAGATQISSS